MTGSSRTISPNNMNKAETNVTQLWSVLTLDLPQVYFQYMVNSKRKSKWLLEMGRRHSRGPRRLPCLVSRLVASLFWPQKIIL